MTLVINAIVESVKENERGNASVYLSATNGGTVTTKGNFNGAQEYTADQIVSNTEGKVLKAEIVLEIEGAESPLDVGQVISFSGHFDRKVVAPAETVDRAVEESTQSYGDGIQRSADEEESAQAE
jgi:hypothetical protein